MEDPLIGVLTRPKVMKSSTSSPSTSWNWTQIRSRNQRAEFAGDTYLSHFEFELREFAEGFEKLQKKSSQLNGSGIVWSPTL